MLVLLTQGDNPMSQFECPVVEVKLEPHPNADTLSIVRVFRYLVVVKTEDWADEHYGVYIPPDSLVPMASPLFSWLPCTEGQEYVRITAKRLRGVPSQGLLLPLSEVLTWAFPKYAVDLALGEDCSALLGINHYEPPTHEEGSTEDEAKGPPLTCPKYDVESFNRWGGAFREGEQVLITEKIHGANGRFVCVDGKLWVGSRTRWKREDPNNMWWRAVAQNPWIEAWCRANENQVLYGEVFGQVQDLKYGAGPGELFVVIFDILGLDGWWSWDDAALEALAKLGWAPVLYEGPFNEESARSMAEYISSWLGALHGAEGVVIRSLEEPFCDKIGACGGRKQLKIVSNEYLASRKG